MWRKLTTRAPNNVKHDLDLGDTVTVVFSNCKQSGTGIGLEAAVE